MPKKKGKKLLNSDLFQVAQNFIPKVTRHLESLSEYKNFLSAKTTFGKKVKALKTYPFNPKFNSVLWGYDLINLISEIVHAYVWMKSWAEFSKTKIPEGSQPSISFNQLSFNCSSCITLIDSTRDKVALMVWAYYCPFNPDKKDEVLIYEKILDRLKYPSKYGLALKNHEKFLEHLKKMQGSQFKEVEYFRHSKIHRREPRIELYQSGPHLEIDNCLPLKNAAMKKEWEQRLKEQYPNDSELRERIKQQCKIGGVQYGSFKPKKLVWEYDALEKHIINCMKLILESSAGCLKILSSRSPLRSRKNAKSN